MTLIRAGWNGLCPLCGKKHAACGPPTTTTPVDERVEVAAVSGPLRKYRVMSGGVETVMKLNQGDAAARGLTDSDLITSEDPEATDGPAPDASASAEPEPTGGEEPEKKAAQPAANKARTTSANKGRGRARGGAGGGD